ncbi:hypothetical protein, partial [Escherichia coli]
MRKKLCGNHFGSRGYFVGKRQRSTVLTLIYCCHERCKSDPHPTPEI